MRRKSKKNELMVKRTVRLKKKKKKTFLISIAFLCSAILITTVFYKLYTDSKNKNISYEVTIIR